MKYYIEYNKDGSRLGVRGIVDYYTCEYIYIKLKEHQKTIIVDKDSLDYKLFCEKLKKHDDELQNKRVIVLKNKIYLKKYDELKTEKEKEEFINENYDKLMKNINKTYDKMMTNKGIYLITYNEKVWNNNRWMLDKLVVDTNKMLFDNYEWLNFDDLQHTLTPDTLVSLLNNVRSIKKFEVK